MTAALLFARFWRPVAAVALFALLVWGYIAWRDHHRALGAAPYIAAIKVQKDAAQAELAAANTRVATAEATVKDLRAAQDERDVQNEKTNADLERRLLVAGQRLRDPKATGCRVSGATGRPESATAAAIGAADPPDATGLLSTDLSRLLRTLTREADAINNAYIASLEDAKGLRVLLQACGK